MFPYSAPLPQLFNDQNFTAINVNILVIFQFTCLLIFSVPSILGANSDFLQAEEAAQVELVRLEEAVKTPENTHKTPDIMAEAETSPESTEEQQRPVKI